MPTQQEWTEKAREQGEKLVLLETTQNYIQLLRDDQVTWRDYYRDVRENVLGK